MILVTIDAHEERDVLYMDALNALKQTKMPVKEDGDCIIIKTIGKLVKWLLEIYPAAYEIIVVVENGVIVLYCGYVTLNILNNRVGINDYVSKYGIQ